MSNNFTYYNAEKQLLLADIPCAALTAAIALLYYAGALLIGWFCIGAAAMIALRYILIRVLKRYKVTYSTGNYSIKDHKLLVNASEIDLHQVTKIYAERQKRLGREEYVLKLLQGKRILFQIVSQPVDKTQSFSDTDLFPLCLNAVNHCSGIDSGKSDEKIYVWVFKRQ